MTAQQLKNSILQMAVQGKLVPQDPNDEPASILLERIKAEKQELIKAGKIKKDKKSSEIFRGASRNLPYAFCEQIGKEIRDISDEIPFEIPDSWEWARLLSVSYHVGDKSNQILSKEVLPDGLIPVVSQGKALIDGYSNRVDKAIDLLPLVMFGDHTRNVKYIDFKFVIGADGTKFHKIHICDCKYIYYWMQFAVVNLRDRGYARHYSLLTEQFLPLPPLSEQHRIVAKIEELLPYIERYGKAEEHLTVLNTTFPEALKKSIMQEAVQGKLIPQDPNDEPASVLLERIRAEKQALIKAGKIKKEKPLAPITEEEIPFEIPESWEWVRLESVTNMISGYAFKSEYYSNEGKYKLLRGINLGVNEIRWDDTAFYNEIPKELEIYKLYAGDVLLGLDRPWISDGIRVAIYKENDENALLVQRVLRIRDTLAIDRRYIELLLRSSMFKNTIEPETTGISVPHISQKQVGNFIIPLPPIEEQKRIVAKIEELMPFINAITK